MRFDAVAFDLDGTLYPAHRLIALALPRMLPIAGRLTAFNQTRRRMRALTATGAAAAPLAGGEAFRARQAELFAGSLGLGAAAARAMIDSDFYAGIEELFVRMRPFRGLPSTLDALEAAGLRLALLSDLPVERKLELLGLSDRFECALCSEDAGALKPSAKPFEMLLSRLGLPPERVLYVGNSPSIDLAGARAAGMAAAIVSRRSVAGADLSFYDWRKLVEFALSG